LSVKVWENVSEAIGTVESKEWSAGHCESASKGQGWWLN